MRDHREELIAYLAVLHAANVQRLRDLAEAIGSEPDDTELPVLAWRLTLQEMVRFIAVGMADKEARV